MVRKKLISIMLAGCMFFNVVYAENHGWIHVNEGGTVVLNSDAIGTTSRGDIVSDTDAVTDTNTGGGSGHSSNSSGNRNQLPQNVIDAYAQRNQIWREFKNIQDRIDNESTRYVVVNDSDILTFQKGTLSDGECKELLQMFADYLANLGYEYLSENQLIDLLMQLNMVVDYPVSVATEGNFDRRTGSPSFDNQTSRVPRKEPYAGEDLTNMDKEGIMKGLYYESGLDNSSILVDEDTHVIESDFFLTKEGFQRVWRLLKRTEIEERIGESDWDGVRTDIFIGGGLTDFTTWSNRYKDFLNRIIRRSANLSDNISVYSIRDYHLTNTSFAKNEILSFDNNVRYWVVYDEAGNVLDEAQTPQRTYVFRADPDKFPAGTYTVKCEAKAKFKKSSYINYRIYEYLIDAETHVILRYVETTTNTDILVESEVIDGRVETGEFYTVIVDSNGNVTMDYEIPDSKTDRIK